MANKQAEADFIKMASRYNIWAHKWQDVRYCPNCRKPIFMTKRMEGEDDQKASIVDYIIVTGNVLHWVECKGKGNHNRLPFKEIEPHQRRFMDSWMEKDVDCWLFVTLGNGKRAPAGRKAWFIPWGAYKYTEEKAVVEAGQKSFSWIPTKFKADVFDMTEFDRYELHWVEGGWSIPFDHPFYPHVEDLEPLY